MSTVPLALLFIGAVILHGCTDHGDDDDVAEADDDAVDDDDTAAGDDDATETGVSTTDDWIAVDAGQYHSCGIRTDHTIECWGCEEPESDDDIDDDPIDVGQCDAPAGAFVEVSAGYYQSCAISEARETVCWGCGGWTSELPCIPPDVRLAKLSADETSWGITESGEGYRWPAIPDDWWLQIPEVVYTTFEAGPAHCCGIVVTDAINCFGMNVDGSIVEPVGAFSEVSVGDRFACALDMEGYPTCWGWDTYGQTVPPVEPLLDVEALHYSACGIRASDRTVVCWGAIDHFGIQPPYSQFVSISAGHTHVCGIRTDGHVECWNGSYAGEGNPP